MVSRKLLMIVLAAWIIHVSMPRSCWAQAPGADAQPPFTLLFDTGAMSASPLAGDALGAKKGWIAIPEDTLTHTFAGDLVFMNDRAAVVLRRNANGVEIYSKSGNSPKQRATLVPLARMQRPGTLSSIKIIENGQAAVMVEAGFAAKSGAIATFRFRLTAGEALLDVRGAQGASRLRVVDQAQYVIVPDFFADDLVFDPATLEGDRIGLPAENSVLGMTDSGNAIVACVWKSSRQNVDLLLSGAGSARSIAGYEIDLPNDSRLWLAVMEGAGIWHARSTAGQKSGAEVALEWKPPMPARWRADFASADGAGLSCYFADPDGGERAESSRGEGVCRFDSGRAMVRTIESAGAAPSRLMVVYPIERSRTTPLTAFCLVDIMRNALGVGPCQYVLDAEGLRTADNPTPDQVMRWVESQFEKKPSRREPDAIRDQLGKMVEQVKRTDARIAQYVESGRKIGQACTQSSNGLDASAMRRLSAIADSMTAPPASIVPTVQKLSAEVGAQAEQKDALAKTQATIAAIRTAGSSQDYALARMRMAARRLKQECRTLAARDAKAASFANSIQQQAEQMLAGK